MIKYNLHTHSNYCDGTRTIEDMIKGALDYEIKVIGFTSHGPLPFETEWTMKQRDLNKYFDELDFLKDKYKDEIDILVGMELDYLPDMKLDYIDKEFFKKLDFWIGSNHFLGKLKNGEYWTIDYSIEEIYDGVKYNFNGSMKEAVIRYYDYMEDMVKNYEPTILGHLDLITKNNKENVLFDPEEKWYKERISRLLDTIEESNTVIEMNTGGKYRGYSKEYYPSKRILEEICTRNLPITISRDAHDIESLNFEYEYSIQYLKEIGFKSIIYFNKNRWNKMKI